MNTIKKVALVTMLGVAFAASAAALKTDPAKSTVTATFKQMNVPIDAKFKKFTANIDYDAAKPETAKATVEVETASMDLGDADYNKEVAKKEWFNAAQFPKATFVSSSIKPAGAGKLTVTGKLTIKGKAADVTFPLTVKADGKARCLKARCQSSAWPTTSAKANGKTPAWWPTTSPSSST
jgi:polyisoprenoid-binding protein YceI